MLPQVKIATRELRYLLQHDALPTEPLPEEDDEAEEAASPTTGDASSAPTPSTAAAVPPYHASNGPAARPKPLAKPAPGAYTTRVPPVLPVPAYTATAYSYAYAHAKPQAYAAAPRGPSVYAAAARGPPAYAPAARGPPSAWSGAAYGVRMVGVPARACVADINALCAKLGVPQTNGVTLTTDGMASRPLPHGTRP